MRETAKRTREVPAELLSRREFGRLAAFLAAGAALPFYNEATLAQDLKALGNIPADAIRLNTNENPLGPCPAALEAIQRALPTGGQYQFGQITAFVEAMAADVGLPASHILPTAGSSDPLHRAVLAYTSPSRPLVLADPGYEAPESRSGIEDRDGFARQYPVKRHQAYGLVVPPQGGVFGGEPVTETNRGIANGPENRVVPIQITVAKGFRQRVWRGDVVEFRQPGQGNPKPVPGKFLFCHRRVFGCGLVRL